MPDLPWNRQDELDLRRNSLSRELPKIRMVTRVTIVVTPANLLVLDEKGGRAHERILAAGWTEPVSFQEGACGAKERARVKDLLPRHVIQPEPLEEKLVRIGYRAGFGPVLLEQLIRGLDVAEKKEQHGWEFSSIGAGPPHLRDGFAAKQSALVSQEHQ